MSELRPTDGFEEPAGRAVAPMGTFFECKVVYMTEDQTPVSGQPVEL